MLIGISCAAAWLTERHHMDVVTGATRQGRVDTLNFMQSTTT